MQHSTAPPPSVPASRTHSDPVPLIPRTRSGRKPLPDAQAISRLRVPEIAPPYDDSAARRTASRRRPAVLPDAGNDPMGRGVPGCTPEPPRAIGQAPNGRAMAAPGGGVDASQAHAWPSRFAQVLAETLAGSRPTSQIVPWTTMQARQRITQLGPMLSASHRPRVRRVIVTSPAGGVLEMTVVVAVGEHVRAVAVRLERTRPDVGQARPTTRGDRGYRRTQSDWLCTAIEAA